MSDALTFSESFLVICALQVAAETGSPHLRDKYKAMAERLHGKVLTASPNPGATGVKRVGDLLYMPVATTISPEDSR